MIVENQMKPIHKTPWVSALEEVSDIILEHTLLGEEMIEYRKHSESYSKW